RAAAHVAARTGTITGTASRSHAAARPIADSASGARTVGSDAGLGERVAQRVHIYLRDVRVGLDNQRWLHHQLGILVVNHRHRRTKLLVGEPRQLALARRRW